MIVKMIQNLGNRREKIQETFNKDLVELKSKQTEHKDKENQKTAKGKTKRKRDKEEI